MLISGKYWRVFPDFYLNRNINTMGNENEFILNIPNLNNLGYLRIVANVTDKHDRSAPSDYHWKILKCRMIIFSTNILSCPDKSDVRQIHVVFNKIGDDFDCLTCLLLKLSLTQAGEVSEVTKDVYLDCFRYTMSAKMAPIWNILGCNYFINNRNFLTTHGFQDGVKYNLLINGNDIKLFLKPVKINFVKTDEKFCPGQKVRVMPSLNEAVIEEFYDSLPKSGDFKCYKDLRRHWKNIHGYRLPDKEHPYYYTVRFWRGDPLTYPEICLAKNLPIIIPTSKTSGIAIVWRFINCLKQKMSYVMNYPLTIEPIHERNHPEKVNNITLSDTQAVSLCTPTQSH